MVLGISIRLDFYQSRETTIKLKVGKIYSRCIIVSSNTLICSTQYSSTENIKDLIRIFQALHVVREDCNKNILCIPHRPFYFIFNTI